MIAIRLGQLALAVLLLPVAFAQSSQSYKPGDFQKTNPDYPKPNPFYFEGRIDWDLLKIDQPGNAWEYAQRGIHKQDDLEDIPGAIADYRTSVSMNNLGNGSCQLITSAPVGFGQSTNPPPCIFTVRLRLANLIYKDQPEEALQLLQQVVQIDPLRLRVQALMGETYATMAGSSADPDEQVQLLKNAVAAYQAELALSPVTELSKKLTGDQANNAHVHWALADLYNKLGQPADEMAELGQYLQATKWHSDTYPWRIQLAQRRLQKLQQNTKR